MAVSKSFGILGRRFKVEIDDQHITVKGAPFASRARARIADVEVAVVQVGDLRRNGMTNLRTTTLQLVGRGTVLGQAAVNTMGLASRSAEDAADWINEELARRR